MSIFNRSALLGGSAPTGYQIERSVRLRSSASASLSRTFPTAGNRQKWTWSGWVKRGALGASQTLFSCYYASNDNETFHLSFFSDNTLRAGLFTQYAMITNQVFRDPSAWYHIVFAFDSTQATPSNRWKLYVNGAQVTSLGLATYPGLNDVWAINAAQIHYHSFLNANGWYFDGYLTDVNFIDGQALTPSSFGETDAVTGVWKPKKYAGTYGTNGFYLNFSDPASTTTIGYDYSGNGNNWTSNNISVTAGVTYDSMIDTPTPYADGGNGRGNYAVLNQLDKYISDGSITNANLTLNGTSNWNACRGSFGMSSGKWYWETVHSVYDQSLCGIADSVWPPSTYYPGYSTTGYSAAYGNNALKYVDGVNTSYGATFTIGDVIGYALDMDAGTLTCYKNGVSQGEMVSGLTAYGTIFPAIAAANGAVINANFGQRPFAYTPPTGFKALQTGNLPEPTIVDGSQFFAVDTYTGTGVAQTRTIGFEPGLVWNKIRSQSYDHNLQDVLRGTGVRLISNSTDQDLSITNCVTAFNSDGYSVGSYVSINGSGESIVNWAWKANGAGVSNTDGSITSTVSAGVTQGFSVVTWAGTSTNASTIGHGLGVAPKMIITKSRSNPTSWVVGIGGISGFGVNDYLTMNTTSAKASSSTFYQAYGSSTFTVGVSAADEMNKTGNNYVSYCFAEVPGFSKFGSYTGNGSADGTFVFTGFRPAYVMIKQTNGTGQWVIQDTSRNTYNDLDLYLLANSSGSEATLANVADYVSNGFKLRANASSTNASGGTYIYMAFAENPFKYALAR